MSGTDRSTVTGSVWDDSPPGSAVTTRQSSSAARSWKLPFSASSRHPLTDTPAPAPELPLTDRDRELARLVAGRCTNKEIAAALYLSEGTVKQYINQLYAKLDMGGDPRTRRARLAEWYQKNAPGINQKLTPG